MITLSPSKLLTLFRFSALVFICTSICTLICTFIFNDSIAFSSEASSLEIGTVTVLQGRVLYRKEEDLHWTAIGGNLKLYKGDQVKTGRNGSAEVTFLSQIKMTVLPLAQVSFIGDAEDFFFRIDRGFVQVLPAVNPGIRALAGPKVRKYSESLARNEIENSGKVDEAPEGQEESSLQDEASLEHSDKGLLKPEPSSQAVVQEHQEIEMAFPKPSLGTIVFHQGRGEVFLQPKKICVNACNLKVQGNGRPIFDQKFEAGTKPVFKLVIPQIQSKQNVLWTLIDGDKKDEGHFQIQPLSPAGLKEALQKGLPSEIVQ